MSDTRYITPADFERATSPDPTPPSVEMEDPERYRIYRLCECGDCKGTGKELDAEAKLKRCASCRGEGKSLDLVATCTDPASVGVALVTLAAEGEFDECPIGLMDRPEGEKGRWLILPWLPSARNVSDAGKLLRSARTP